MLDVLNHLGNYMEPTKIGFGGTKKRERAADISDKAMTRKMWQGIVQEILAAGVSVECLAQQLEVSIDSVDRMQKGQTAHPRYNVVAKLFVFHMLYRPDRYGQPPLRHEWLLEQGWDPTGTKTNG